MNRQLPLMPRKASEEKPSKKQAEVASVTASTIQHHSVYSLTLFCAACVLSNTILCCLCTLQHNFVLSVYSPTSFCVVCVQSNTIQCCLCTLQCHSMLFVYSPALFCVVCVCSTCVLSNTNHSGGPCRTRPSESKSEYIYWPSRSSHGNLSYSAQ